MSEPASDASVRLPRSYDSERLKRDLEAVRHIELQKQPGPYHNGDWKGVSLHAQGGRQSAHPGYAGLDGYYPTDAMRHTPYLAEILDALPCPKKVVRLLTLPPDAEIEEHNDAWANFQCGTLRLHIPIVTHPDVVFFIDGERVSWNEGELWYGDFSRPHWLRNESSIVRVHAVIDVEINDFTLSLFPDDFIARRRAEGEGISMHCPSVAMSADELASHCCDFQMPPSAMPLFGAGRKLSELTAGARGSLRVVDGRLVAFLDDKQSFALDPLGGCTFGIVGLSSGCTIDIAREGPKVTALDLVLKGLPEDLYAAQLGYQQGPMVAKRRLALPLTCL